MVAVVRTGRVSPSEYEEEFLIVQRRARCRSDGVVNLFSTEQRL